MDPRNKSSQELAQERAKQLRERITDYLEAEKSIVTGFRAEEQIRKTRPESRNSCMLPKNSGRIGVGR